MPAPRRSRRRQGQQERDPFSPVQWPINREQVELQSRLDPAEIALAQQRCQALITRGYSAVTDWLLSDPSPAERSAMQGQRKTSQKPATHQVLDLFDQESASSTPQAG